jgi:RNA polymerase sigma-70 factor (ECF subfamily)
MTGSPDDNRLIAECRAGKTEAFGVLVRRYQDRLYPTLFRLAGSAEDALDLLQEAFLRAYQKLGYFNGESSFYTWIYRIAINLALSELRKRRHDPDAGVGYPLEPRDERGDDDPAAALLRAERAERIQQALAALAPDHRTILVMKEFDDLRYDEIGAMLGIPVGTVRSRLHRARCELRGLLHDLVDDALPAASGSGSPDVDVSSIECQ